MFYAISTKDNLKVKAFETKTEAAEWLLDTIPSERHGRDYWLEDGELIANHTRVLDYGLYIYPSFEAAIRSCFNMDMGAMPVHMKAICDAAIEAEDGA